ncbi:hypothetical protein HYC85_025139 [Camellia sinensis]|uniref:Uncharacterized protein n=1 Tax=Camellia sinensis TaxID=4442 RepID=A0A7J7GA32_CAMSI|nr:hypothetical protein HYC85_025139 [Camellia sinensis]
MDTFAKTAANANSFYKIGVYLIYFMLDGIYFRHFNNSVIVAFHLPLMRKDTR